MSELDVLKDIPGYKAILKSVLKSQIQLLLEQLSDNTGEESIILTASVNDGTLSHLGSNTGKGFLEGRDEIKSQFLGYCLKTHHKQTTPEPKPPYPTIQPKPPHMSGHPMGGRRSRFPSPHSSHRGSPYTRPILPRPLNRRPSTNNTSESSFQVDSQIPGVSAQSSESPVIIKQELGDSASVHDTDNTAPLTDNGGGGGSDETGHYPSAPVSFPSSLGLSHTQTSGAESSQAGQNDLSLSESKSDGVEGGSNLDSSVKIEPITENEMELEITGVEMGDGVVAPDQWGQVGYSSEGDNSFTNQSGDQLQFNKYHNQGQMAESDIEDEEPRPLDGSLIEVSVSQEVSSRFECDICGKTFKYKNNLSRHLNVHRKEAFPCKKCTRFFKCQKDLDEHCAAKHSQRVVCEVCGTQYNRKEDLTVHIKTIHNSAVEGSMVCPFDGCSKRFNKRTKYQDHLNIHTGLQPYSCSDCKTTFKDRYERNLHQRVCTGKKEFRCDVCNSVFRHRSSLKKHVDGVHNGKLFVCCCGSKYAFRSGLRRHQVEKNHINS